MSGNEYLGWLLLSRRRLIRIELILLFAAKLSQKGAHCIHRHCRNTRKPACEIESSLAARRPYNLRIEDAIEEIRKAPEARVGEDARYVCVSSCPVVHNH